MFPTNREIMLALGECRLEAYSSWRKRTGLGIRACDLAFNMVGVPTQHGPARPLFPATNFQVGAL